MGKIFCMEFHTKYFAHTLKDMFLYGNNILRAPPKDICLNDIEYIDGLGQDSSNSSALTVKLLQPCTKPSIMSVEYTVVCFEDESLYLLWFRCQVMFQNTNIYFSFHSNFQCFNSLWLGDAM